MKEARSYIFGEYRLDIENARLSKAEQVIALPPKAFAILVYLLERCGVLVGKDELLDAVWGHRYVSEGVLKSAVQVLRQALSDDARAPRYLETVHRRGYRFVMEASPLTTNGGLTPSVNIVHERQLPVVGRDAEIALMQDSLTRALAGVPQLLFLSGQAGIGKTTLIEHFLLTNAGQLVIARGQCVEQYGQGEPYLPILEILNSVCRQLGDTALKVLEKTAPDWLAELPWLADGQPSSGATDNTRTRLLRELGELLERWSNDFALLLVLEDLHWSDHATLDALAYLIRRRTPARWLILASYRPEQPGDGDQTLARLVRDLQLRGLAQEVALSLLSESAVADYLRRCLNDASPDRGLIHALYQRSEGLPFFLAQLIDNLDSNGLNPLEALPIGLQHLLDQQFERLTRKQQELLSVGAVVGSVFGVAIIATLLEIPETEVESLCELMVRGRRFLEKEQSSSGYYSFRHAYYHEYVYLRLPSVAKAELHRKVAYWLENYAQAGLDDSVASLARHFELGRVFDKALVYFERAAVNARKRQASNEVIKLTQKALGLLENHLSNSEEYLRRRIGLYSQMGIAMRTIHGYGFAEQALVYGQALDLARQLGEPSVTLPLIKAISYFHLVRLELEAAERHAQELLNQAVEYELPHFQLSAHLILAGVDFIRADVGFYEHAEHAATLYTPDLDVVLLSYSAQHPLASLGYMRSWRLWLDGYPDQALQTQLESLAAVEKLGHPISTAFACICTAVILQLRGEWEYLNIYCDKAEALAEEYDLESIRRWSLIFRGWLLINQGEKETGLGEMSNAVEDYIASGSKGIFTYHMLLSFAEVCLLQGERKTATSVLQRALNMMNQHESCFLEAELYRLQGELILLDPHHVPSLAATKFRQALACAERQGARSLALRAASSLAKLQLSQENGEWLALERITASFTEGLQSRDLHIAAEILSSCSRTKTVAEEGV